MRTIEEIYQELLGAFAQCAGFVPEEDCDLSVRLWAAAAQLQALGVQADWVLDQSFPQTAQGVYLDRHAAMRGIQRREAVKAAGVLRFSVESEPVSDIAVPEGTVCMTEGQVRFITTEAVTLKAGSLFVDAQAEALEGGSGGNALADTIRVLTACPVAVTACTNPVAFTGGRDAEGDEELRSRILESYQRLPNGANAAWYEATAMSHTGVTAAKAVGRARGIGTVDVYVTTESGLPDAQLLEQLQELLREKREIAVDVEVKAPQVRTVDVAVEIRPKDNAAFEDVKAAAELALTTFFNGRLLGGAVRLAELGHLIYGLEGVENYRFSAPVEDLAAEVAVLPVLGSLSVTEMEA